MKLLIIWLILLIAILVGNYLLRKRYKEVPYPAPIKDNNPKPRCRYCNSKNIKHGYWIRGWNNLCQQGAGDEGWWCYKCLKVTFKKSLEEYIKTKQDWVTAWY